MNLLKAIFYNCCYYFIVVIIRKPSFWWSLCLLPVLKVAHTMQKNDRSMDDSQRESVSYNHLLFIFIFPFTFF